MSDAGVVSGKNATASQIEKTLKRDGYSCRFCGFTAQKFQRVVFYQEEKGKGDFVTACIFCEQVMMLERSGLSGSGTLIWYPEMSQADLNNLVRTIYVTRGSKSPLAEQANKALDFLTARRADAKKRLGGDDPLLLATVMTENLSDEEYALSHDKLAGVRYLPGDKYIQRTPQGDVNQFPAILDYWRSLEKAA